MPLCSAQLITSCRGSWVVVLLVGVDVVWSASCSQPLYTTKVEILSAATRAPFGHQRDAFGLVVGKLQIKYRTFATFSNTANQTRLYEAQLGEDFPVFPVFCLVIPLRLFESEI